MRKNKYKAGEHNVICDATGFKLKSGKMAKQWDGAIVRRESLDGKDPSFAPITVRKPMTVRDPRPRGVDEHLHKHLLKESGDFVLLEDGTRIYLE